MNPVSHLRLFARFAGLVAICAGILSLLAALFNCTPPVPVWAMSLLAAVAVAAIVAAYRRERALVRPATGRAILALRLLSTALVAFMLMQPVLLRTVGRKIVRTVAVLVDTSDSMRFTDTAWSPGESISLALESGLLADGSRVLPSLDDFRRSCDALRPWLEEPFPGGEEPEACRRSAREALASARRLVRELARGPLAGSTNAALAAFSASLSGRLVPALARPVDDNSRETVCAAIDAASACADAAQDAADGLLWESLDQGLRAEISRSIETNRLAVAARIAFGSLATLSDGYSVRHFSMGRRAEPVSAEALDDIPQTPSQSSSTDFAMALEDVMQAVPAEELAGVVMLTDGLANGDAPVEPVARRLASRGVKVSSVIVGSSASPRDLALADVSAPESVFLGDKVRVRSRLRAAGAVGETAAVSLWLDGEKVDDVSIPVPTGDFSRDFSLSFAPTNRGIARFTVKIDGIEGERFPSNNVWNVDVAVSDDRTNVLLVDDYPRWDFRYLRNLFYARDKSVHLQYHLVHPDTIADIDTTNRPPAASASRPFGEAEAGALPENAEEWRKFDVIVLGDVGPGVITDEIASTVTNCVAERGALLVAIAGPRAMPHAYPDGSPIRDILPAIYPPHSPDSGFWTPPEESFMPVLTPEGRMHQISQQSASAAENDHVWRSLRPCAWRIKTAGVKAGAEIIATAAPVGGDSPSADSVTSENALELMDAGRAAEVENALIVAHNVGRGKVLVLNTDESWRLRYRTGDTRHHRFWGQVIRWGLGDRLRSGNDRLRLGSDRLAYSPGDPVRLLARISGENGEPVGDAKPVAEVRPSSAESTHDGAVRRIALSRVAGSPNLYEAVLPPSDEEGAFIFRIEGSGDFDGGAAETPEAMFFVAAARRPVEMSSVAASAEIPAVLADITGGTVTAPDGASSLVGSFGEKSRTETVVVEIALWDGKWLFILLLLSLAAEWTLRKKGGLV